MTNKHQLKILTRSVFFWNRVIHISVVANFNELLCLRFDTGLG